MPLYEELQRESTSKPAKSSTKLLVGAGVLLLLIWVYVFTLQGGYYVEEGMGHAPSGENAAPSSHDTQASR